MQSIAGLILCLVIVIIAYLIGSKFDPFAIIAPIFVLTLVRLYRQIQYVKK